MLARTEVETKTYKKDAVWSEGYVTKTAAPFPAEATLSRKPAQRCCAPTATRSHPTTPFAQGTTVRAYVAVATLAKPASKRPARERALIQDSAHPSTTSLSPRTPRKPYPKVLLKVRRKFRTRTYAPVGLSVHNGALSCNRFPPESPTEARASLIAIVCAAASISSIIVAAAPPPSIICPQSDYKCHHGPPRNCQCQNTYHQTLTCPSS